MEECDDFYLQDVGQMRLDTWTKGSVVAVGDAAYCPSVLTGGGTTTAFMGAWILAGEICKSSSDLSSACKSYETIFRPYMTVGQKIMPGAPWILTPATNIGCTIYRGILGLLAWAITTPFVRWLSSGKSEKDDSPMPGFVLPDYPQLTKADQGALDDFIVDEKERD